MLSEPPQGTSEFEAAPTLVSDVEPPLPPQPPAELPKPPLQANQQSQPAANLQSAGARGPSRPPSSRPREQRLSEPIPPPTKKRSGWKRVVGIISALIALVGIGVAVFAYVMVQRYTEDLPSVAKLKAGYDPPQITRVFARDDSVLASLFTERRTVIPMDQIPKEAKLAFLAAEDAYFYEHEGLNYFGMARALVANVRAGKTVQGGSTITQQVVKNVLLDSERSMRRKVREVALAGRLEQELSKDDIFWLYLNHIYLGHGRWGIEEAARYYFGKHAKELGLDEAALLAGLIAAPERYSPRRDPEKALQRRRYVLSQMLEKQFVTKELHDKVLKMPLRLAPAAEHESELVPEIVDIAKAALKKLAPKHAEVGGYELHTTIDPDLQAAARSATRKALDDYMQRHQLAPPYNAGPHKLWAEPFQGKPRAHRIYTGIVDAVDDHAGVIDVKIGDVVGRVALSTETRYNPEGLPPSKFTQVGAALRVGLLEAPGADGKPPLRLELGPQAALVAMDVRTREVLALVGNYEALAGGLDRATRTRRQPGSTFKAFTYSYALHSRRFTPATVIPVKKRGYGIPEDAPLQINVRDALAHSNNEAAVEIYKQSGPENVVQWARALGIESKLEPDLSAALGSYEATVLEIANAYAAFAAGGASANPRFVSKVLGADGRELELPAAMPPRPVLTEAEAYLTTSLLRSVVEYGTGRRAKSLGRELAGKTGTTNQAKDAWFAGYSTDIVAAVWVGYDDARPLGRGESGARTALPAWIDFMQAAHKGKPKTRFARPAGVLTVSVDPVTGLLPRPDQEEVHEEEFLSGTEPTEMAPLEPAATPDAGAPTSPEGPAEGDEAADEQDGAEAEQVAEVAGDESAEDAPAPAASEQPQNKPKDQPASDSQADPPEIPPPPPF